MAGRNIVLFLLCCVLSNAAVRSLRKAALRSKSKALLVVEDTPSYVLKLSNNNNVEYVGDFTFGTQTLQAIYDTGSFEVVTLSTLCKACDREGAVYDRKKSETFEELHEGTANEELHVHQYGSGPVWSSKGEETLRIGDGESPLKVESMPFYQVVKHEITAWETSKFVAIIGLGPLDKVPPMQGLEEEKETEDTLLHRLGLEQFSVCLGRGNFAPGLLGFGPKIASLKKEDVFSSLEVVGKIHWGVKMTNWAPGDFNPCDPSCGTVIDSGTTFLSVSPKALEAMALSGLSDQINKDCSNLDDLPDITFELDGQKFSLPPAAYVMEVEFEEVKQITLLEKGIQKKIKELHEQGVTRGCVAAFQEIDHETQFGPMMILGMPFLRYFYTIFDRHEKKIYTAPSTEECSPLQEKSQSFVLKKDMQKRSGNATTSGRHRSNLDVQPTPVDLRHARFESGLLKPGMPHRIEL